MFRRQDREIICTYHASLHSSFRPTRLGSDRDGTYLQHVALPPAQIIGGKRSVVLPEPILSERIGTAKATTTKVGDGRALVLATT